MNTMTLPCPYFKWSAMPQASLEDADTSKLPLALGIILIIIVIFKLPGKSKLSHFSKSTKPKLKKIKKNPGRSHLV